MDHHGGQRLREQFDVDVGGDLAAPYRTVVDPLATTACRGATGSAPGRPASSSLSRCSAVSRPAITDIGISEVNPPSAHEIEIRSPRRLPVSTSSGTGQPLARLIGIDHQFRLGRPAPVQRRLAGLGGRRHRVHGQPVVAEFRDDFDGRVEDLVLATAFDPGPVAWSDCSNICHGRLITLCEHLVADRTKRFRFINHGTTHVKVLHKRISEKAREWPTSLSRTS